MNPYLLIVMAHAEAQDTFDRHLPYWQRHGHPLLVVCPTDSIVKTTWPLLAMEQSMHNGVAVNRKFLRILRFCETMEYERFMFLEYDALCVTKDIPTLKDNTVYGNLFTSDQKEFKGHYFLHPPICFDKPVLKRLNAYAATVPEETDRFWDRLIGYLVEYGKIPFSGYGNLGFARNTIEPEHIQLARDARKAGAVFFHGVKSESALKAVLCD